MERPGGSKNPHRHVGLGHETDAPRGAFAARNLIHRLLAVPAFLALLPLFVLVATALAVEAFLRGESARVVFHEQRVSQGQAFRLYRFRVLAEPEVKRYLQRHPTDSVRLLEREGSKLTWVGRIIHATQLHHLPELINVLLGDMNLVGPRPFAVAELEEFPHLLIESRRVLRAGVIGPYQAGAGPAVGGDASTGADSDFLKRIAETTLLGMIREDAGVLCSAIRTACRRLRVWLVRTASG